MPEVEGEYHYLCCNCGFITPYERWTFWQYDEILDALVPNPLDELDETDPIMRCPVCLWEHTDDDSNPGIFDGPYYACSLERQTLAEMFQDHWDDTAAEIFEPDV